MEKDARQTTNYSWKQWNYNFEVVYLRVLYNYRQQDTHIVYADETCSYIAHTTPYEATKGSEDGVKFPPNKTERLIIIHAGEINVAQNTIWNKIKFGDYTLTLSIVTA
jgi:hypothetical protein